jgi:predicted extracellular nuclease
MLVPRDDNGTPVHGWDDQHNLVRSLLYLWDASALQPILATTVPGSGGAMATAGALMTTRVDDQTNPSYIYIGKAAVGSSESAAVWQIQRIPTSGIVTAVYADGNGNFDNVWTNRGSLTYS